MTGWWDADSDWWWGWIGTGWWDASDCGGGMLVTGGGMIVTGWWDVVTGWWDASDWMVGS